MIPSRSGRCVVFDLDDTLYDEIDFVRSGYRAVADALLARYKADCRAFLEDRWQTRALDGAFQAVVAAHGLGAEAVTWMVEVYRDHKPVIRPRDGVSELLEKLKEDDGVLGCITDGRGRTQHAKLEALGLDVYFDVVLVSEETGHSKPDPFNFEEMMRRVDAQRWWYVADNPMKDFFAPKALGWKTVCVRSERAIHAVDWNKIPDAWRPDWECAVGEVGDEISGIREKG
jgi:putative hydrolase of the HAD superfamily